jgi:hypothetical protein
VKGGRALPDAALIAGDCDDRHKEAGLLAFWFARLPDAAVFGNKHGSGQNC